MQNRSVLFLVVVLALAGLSGWFAYKTPPAYGLDVRGGSRFIYKMDLSGLSKDQQQNVTRIQKDLVKIMGGRASGALGVSEPVVAEKGTDQIVIELPGYTNADEAKSVISNTAKVICYWAKNVSTVKRERRFINAGDAEIGGVNYVTFARRTDASKTFKPGDPEYLEIIEGWEPILEGPDVADAKPLIDGNKTKPNFFFSADGSRKLEAWSRRYMNQGENIAFVLDGRVLSIAPIKDNTILSNEAFIDGDFPPKYVNQLTELIKAGSLPVPLIEQSQEQVDPTIGKHALDKMIVAGGISLAVICLCLILYYAFAGVVATFAMVLYALFTYAILLAINTTFSLASIAAFILSTGMAIDANILVFERLKEEIRNGKTVLAAIPISFKRAFNAIIDSNLCTVITSLVLFWYGTGQVKGFASTLILGIAVSFFTAFITTRALLETAVRLGIGAKPGAYAVRRSWFGGRFDDHAVTKPLDIVGKSGKYFLISGLLIVPGLIAVAMGGIKKNVEFQGGTESSFVVPAGKSEADIRSGLDKAGIHGYNLKFAESKEGPVVYVTIPPIKDMTREKVADMTGLPLEKSSFSAIGPTIQAETVNNAIMGVVLSSALILAYLAIRFGTAVGGFKNGVKFGSAAVIALVHDVLFVLGIAGIVGIAVGWEISALFITAVLTVIGFSVHDTIIIFDRVRENLLRPHKGQTFEHLCDVSVTQSVARSLNTSFSAIIPLAVLFFFGTTTPELKFMCLAMLTGIGIGAYSSIFNATPILYLWDKAVIKARGEEAGLMAESAREIAARAHSAARAGTTLQPAAQTAGTAPSGYGTVKRRGGIDQSKKNLDEDQD